MTINEIKKLSRNTSNGQHPLMDALSAQDRQTLMDQSGFADEQGHAYEIVVSQGKRALAYLGPHES